MAVLNNGLPVRLINGTVWRVYTSATAFDTVAYIEQGSLQISVPGRNPIMVNADARLDVGIQGDERAAQVRVTVKNTKFSLAGTNNIKDAVKNAYTAGSLTFKKHEFRIPDYDGATTGTSIICNKMFLPNLFDLRSQAQAPDSLEFNFANNEDEPTIARY